jgi:hypothetical protein
VKIKALAVTGGDLNENKNSSIANANPDEKSAALFVSSLRVM